MRIKLRNKTDVHKFLAVVGKYRGRAYLNCVSGCYHVDADSIIGLIYLIGHEIQVDVTSSDKKLISKIQGELLEFIL